MNVIGNINGTELSAADMKNIIVFDDVTNDCPKGYVQNDSDCPLACTIYANDFIIRGHCKVVLNVCACEQD